jgi:hypothetical protein
VGDAPAEPRGLAELLVDVDAREVARDPGEEVDVGLAERLADRPTRRRRRSSAR